MVRRTECNAAFSPSGIAEFSKTLIWFVFPLGACRPDGHRQECNSKVLGQDAMFFLIVLSNTDLRRHGHVLVRGSRLNGKDPPVSYLFNVKIKLQISAQQQGPESSLHFKTKHPERLSTVIHMYTDPD